MCSVHSTQSLMTRVNILILHFDFVASIVPIVNIHLIFAVRLKAYLNLWQISSVVYMKDEELTVFVEMWLYNAV